MELDDFDLQILQSLQEDNQRTSQEVAERVNLSPVSCLRRMKRLRESGVVLGDVSVVEPAAVGRDIMMVVLVSLESERADKLDTFKRAMRGAPEIMQCLAVTGEVDFVVTMTCLLYTSMARCWDKAAWRCCRPCWDWGPRRTEASRPIPRDRLALLSKC